ncbi:MAG: hypothetical protein DDT33_00031 [Firmicutes bacterium]|nr:hypothetical protein [Bacillota bacterium]
MNTDQTFFTNEPGSTLLDRFGKTLKDVQYFDVLVGYFRIVLCAMTGLKNEERTK